MIRSLPPAEQIRPFFQLWTLKEALCKALGEGLRMRFDEVGFELEPLRLVAAPRSAGALEMWRLAQWRAAPDHIVALALCASAPLDVLAWQTSAHHLWSVVAQPV
jgi:4'-phosphopantetheinyl transferase